MRHAALTPVCPEKWVQTKIWTWRDHTQCLLGSFSNSNFQWFNGQWLIQMTQRLDAAHWWRLLLFDQRNGKKTNQRASHCWNWLLHCLLQKNHKLWTEKCSFGKNCVLSLFPTAEPISNTKSQHASFAIHCFIIANKLNAWAFQMLTFFVTSFFNSTIFIRCLHSRWSPTVVRQIHRRVD